MRLKAMAGTGRLRVGITDEKVEGGSVMGILRPGTVALAALLLVPSSLSFQGNVSFAGSKACPGDMVDMGGYCIDRHPTKTFVNWYEAADQCQLQKKRLCTNSEWLQACDASPLNEVEEMPGRHSEWLDKWVFETSDKVFDAMDHGYFRCRTSSHPWPSYRPYQIKWFRCCLNSVSGAPD
jgi:hypothetical protein